MMQIDINEDLAIIKRRREINSIPLEEIIWMDGEKTLDVRKEWIEEFKFMGLNNMDFIDMEIYKNGIYDSN